MILDEPMSGLDPIGRALVKEIILELKAAGKCVFFSTHITSDAEAICDRVGIILQGRLQCVERVETIMTPDAELSPGDSAQQSLEKFFLEIVRKGSH